MHPTNLSFGFAPYRLSGTVFGVLLNHAPALAALGEQVNEPPYKAPPKAPVLYVKPQHPAERARLVRPADAPMLQVGANLGIVIGRIGRAPNVTRCRLSPATRSSMTRARRMTASTGRRYATRRDGSCVIGPAVVPRDQVRNPDAPVRVFVDGRLCRAHTRGRVRPVAKLLADVTDFMTPAPGDILMLGTSVGHRPRVGRTSRSRSMAWAA
jgi:5-oxopent-3-ene-1,2,5-tricarboxylate decarboxylase/2-hydroxyhepta-2,4-diene-1,7-dioate isomerase